MKVVVCEPFLQSRDNDFSRSSVVFGFGGGLHVIRVGNIVEGHCEQMVSHHLSESRVPNEVTIFWHIHPYVVFVEGVPICIETPQSRLVHGSILLMPEHNSIAWLAFSRPLSTLPTDWGDFIAFKLSLAACLTVGGQQVSMSRWRLELVEEARTHQPVRDLIAS
jgi:hypothetical protein